MVINPFLPWLAIDTETFRFGVGYMAPEVVCLTTGKGTISTDPDEWVELISDPTKYFVGHNIAYDMTCLLSTRKELLLPIFRAYMEDRIVDIGILTRLIGIAHGSSTTRAASLAKLAWLVLEKELPKEDDIRLNFGALKGVPLSEWPEDMVKYAVNDAVITQEIFDEVKNMTDETPTLFDDVRAAFALHLMSTYGVLTSQSKIEELMNHFENIETAIKKNLIKNEILRYNGVMNTSKVKDRLLAMDYNTKRTGKGAVSTSAEILKDSGDPLLADVVEYKQTQKILSTYLRNWKTSPIHPKYWVLGADSGRTSCSKPNLQNLPRDNNLRECFVPRPGYVYVACDYDSQELRTLAQVCIDLVGYSRLAERYRASRNFDPHTEFAAVLMGITAKEAMALKKAKDPELKSFRQRAKAANFGFPGGLGPKTFVDYAKSWGLNLTLKEAKDLKAEWLHQWPEMHDYFRVCDGMGSTMVSARVGLVCGGVRYTRVCNGHFQTLAAYASKAALFDVTLKCFCLRESNLFGSRPVLFVHDEIIIESPMYMYRKAAKELEDTMVEAMDYWTPNVPVSASAHAMDRWYKEAYAVFDENGELKIYRGSDTEGTS